MKKILKWLEAKFSRHSAAVEVDEAHNGAESREPGKAVHMPNIYDCDDPFKQRQLKTLDNSSLDASESTGFDPYNSGSFETSKSRSTSSS
jgi:hypothetical protein